MRWAVAIAVMLVWIARASAQPADRTHAVGFDHNIHGSRVAVSAKDPIPCNRCHAWRAGALVGKPGHAACFGECHGAAPVGKPAPQPPERMRVCVACHAEAALAAPARPGAYAVAYPPYRAGADHALAFGHRQHAAIACTHCHARTDASAAAPRGPPHRRCAGCHDGAAGRGPAMTECAKCHEPASGTPAPPRLAVTNQVEVVVTSAFSHAKHAARPGAGRQCATCHAAILGTNERELPRPTADGCATSACHDGSAAFPITAACTKCHRDAPAEKYEVARPEARFSHAVHKANAPSCATCHPLAKNGDVLVADHAPCAPCHAADFGARQPKICGACHNATEPWRPLRPDRPPPDRTEFGATIDHQKHRAACATCHSLTTATAQLRPPRGHRACTSAGCHAVSGGPAPVMTACAACHAEGRAEGRRRARLAAPWSVRAAFDHATHQRSACAACHVDLAGPDLAKLATPPKAACAACHDGATAFKLTGTTCTRCHGPRRR